MKIGSAGFVDWHQSAAMKILQTTPRIPKVKGGNDKRVDQRMPMEAKVKRKETASAAHVSEDRAGNAEVHIFNENARREKAKVHRYFPFQGRGAHGAQAIFQVRHRNNGDRGCRKRARAKEKAKAKLMEAKERDKEMECKRLHGQPCRN